MTLKSNHQPVVNRLTDDARDATLGPPAAECPDCGRKPAMRYTDTMKTLASAVAPDSLLLSVQCQNRACRKIFGIRARDLA